MFSIHSKKYSTPTWGIDTKNMIVRINAPNSCKCLSWKVSIAKKEACAMPKLFIKERKKEKRIEKNGQVFEILKTMGT